MSNYRRLTPDIYNTWTAGKTYTAGKQTDHGIYISTNRGKEIIGTTQLARDFMRLEDRYISHRAKSEIYKRRT
tara:strand:- start:74611 stop:74829 length:219 start_codon:yes stop_codon:yes gene_type:complete